MVNARDVPSAKLISALAEQMKSVSAVQEPDWARYVKTGSHAERPPTNSDWWFTRAASLLRKLYLHGPVGLGDLERAYGGTKALHYYPKHHRDAGGSSIRKILKQLEQAELVSKTPKGRVLTPKGRAMLDKTSREVFTALAAENKALARYA
ncbi:MAG: 30S ribosomal protein S19e [Nitrososphaerota archaeon]|jgi:small subunit ribosomal protein S19e|nr:30S ribosomal protein S19e [Nitrososphaerota archaeon]MDG6964141.1 30S ribosomal protein S19e [Nitrososphaerota archaeon]MDG6968634.1 30S ribosomal protein S19e [Nitrososphaerota archaeon]